MNKFVGVAWRGQTYANVAYLFAAFPLGLIYFIILVTGLALGVGTAVIGVGVLVLLGMLALVWGLAIVERALTIGWLKTPVAPMAPPATESLPFWRRVRSTLRNPVTWTSLAYLLAKFPFGIFTFVLIVTAFSVSLSLILTPVAYIVTTQEYYAFGSTPIQLFLVTINGRFDIGSFLFTVIVGIAGCFIFLVALHALNGLAAGWAQFARLTLGMSQAARRLAEARAIAERERARAERADQTRRELIVNVSHELRTPVASIRGHVESLLLPHAEPEPEAERQRYLGIVMREADRLSALVDDLLALARADARELRLEVRPVDVGEIVEEVYQTLAPLARRERQITLTRQALGWLPRALADRDRLTQALLNLVRNAIAYTPEGGIVSITLERADQERLALTVSDTGVGMAPDELERVFERFYRADASRSRATGGSGLGLSIVHDLVEAMGGTISATSAPGEGSQFRITLRIAGDHLAPSASGE